MFQWSAIVKSFMTFCNVYSLVVVFGSVSTAYFFSYYWGVSHGILFYWFLASSVWLLYTIDHLFDANRMGNSASSLRHRLHHKHGSVLMFIVFLIIGFNSTLAWLHFKTEAYILYGVVLFIFFCLYLLVVKGFHKRGKIFLFKETLVAMFASFGMAISPAFGQGVFFNFGSLLLVLNFTLLNFVNLLTFSRFDLRNDAKDKMLSLASYLGFAKTSRLIFNLLAVIFLLTTVWLFADHWNEKMKGALMLMIMINVLALVNLRYDHFKQNSLYRFWGDFIYLIPGLLVFLRIASN